MRSILLVLLVLGAVAQDTTDEYIPYTDDSITASSFLSDDTLPRSVQLDGKCGWVPAYVDGTQEGQWLQLSFDQPYTVTALDVQGEPTDCGACVPPSEFELFYSIDGEDWTTLGVHQGPADCETKLRIPINPGVVANFLRIMIPACPAPATGSSGASLSCVQTNVFGPFRASPCGAVYISNPLDCPKGPVSPKVPYTPHDLITYPGCPYNTWSPYKGNGTVCFGTCYDSFDAWPAQPNATCVNGKWIYTGGCEGRWPTYQDPHCSVLPQYGGQAVWTPDYAQLPVIVEDGEWPGKKISNRDHIHFEFVFNASYRVINITGGNPTTHAPITPLAPGVPEFNDYLLYYKFTGPFLCKGYLSVRIAIGDLKNWGFKLNKVGGVWQLEGELFVTEARETEIAGRRQEQVVVSDFPVRVKLCDTLLVDLNCNMTVYGTPNASAEVILFEEGKYPDQMLTVWYLLAVQYPFMAIDTGLSARIYVYDPIPPSHQKDIVNVVGLPLTLTPHRGVKMCDSEDTSTTQPLFCYQMLKVVFTRIGDCKDGPLTYTGTSELKWQIGCRILPPATTPISWCEMPEDPNLSKAVGLYPIFSNDICRVDLKWDPTKDVVSQMVQTHDPNPSTPMDPSTVDLDSECCGFVAGTKAYFLIYLTDLKLNHSIMFTDMTLLNLTYQLDNGPRQLIYDTSHGAWSGTQYWYAPEGTGLVADYDIGCNGNPDPGCKITIPPHDPFPYITFVLYLDPITLGLLGRLTPKKLSLLAGVQVNYGLPTSDKAALQAQTQTLFLQPGSVVMLNTESTNYGPATAAAPSSNLILIVACCAAGVVIAIATVAGVFTYRKKRALDTFHEDPTL